MRRTGQAPQQHPNAPRDRAAGIVSACIGRPRPADNGVLKGGRLFGKFTVRGNPWAIRATVIDDLSILNGTSETRVQRLEDALVATLPSTFRLATHHSGTVQQRRFAGRLIGAHRCRNRGSRGPAALNLSTH